MTAALASLFKYTGGMSAEQQEGKNGGGDRRGVRAKRRKNKEK